MAERDVLIVDDDAQVGDVLCRMFGAAGYPCRLVGDGGEALEVFKVWRPPLVVTDVLHPGITGIELLRQVRAVDGDRSAEHTSERQSLGHLVRRPPVP